MRGYGPGLGGGGGGHLGPGAGPGSGGPGYGGGSGGGFGSGRDISVMLSGSDSDLLNQTAQTLVEQMRGIPGVVAPRRGLAALGRLSELPY